MTKTGYDYGGVQFDEGGYSQDIRNCEKCHDPANPATPQAASGRPTRTGWPAVRATTASTSTPV